MSPRMPVGQAACSWGHVVPPRAASSAPTTLGCSWGGVVFWVVLERERPQLGEMEQGSRCVNHKGQGKGIWIWACRWGCTETTWRQRGAEERSSCRGLWRVQQWRGASAEGDLSKEEKSVGHQERMVAPWVPGQWKTQVVSSGLCTAPCDFTGWSAEVSYWSLTFFLSSGALLSLLRREQTPRRQRTGWDILHYLPALERSALLKPRRRRGVESCQSQGIRQAGALWSTESWERRGRAARGFPWASKHLSCTATGFIITLLPRFQFSETARF